MRGAYRVGAILWDRHGQVGHAGRKHANRRGATILAEAVSVPIYNADFFSVGRIHMQMSGGTGTSDILQSRNARVSLEMSKDGRNWDNERWRDIGNIGEYGKVIEWHGMGAFRRAQIRVRVSDPVKRDLHGIQYDVA